jgi:hypothetical protein
MSGHITIRHIDLSGGTGAHPIGNMTGCSEETAKQFVSAPTEWDAMRVASNTAPPRPYIRLERAEIAAEQGDTVTALSEFEYLYNNHRSVCVTHVAMYKAKTWTHFIVFCRAKDEEQKARCSAALSGKS